MTTAQKEREKALNSEHSDNAKAKMFEIELLILKSSKDGFFNCIVSCEDISTVECKFIKRKLESIGYVVDFIFTTGSFNISW